MSQRRIFPVKRQRKDGFFSASTALLWLLLLLCVSPGQSTEKSSSPSSMTCMSVDDKFFCEFPKENWQEGEHCVDGYCITVSVVKQKEPSDAESKTQSRTRTTTESSQANDKQSSESERRFRVGDFIYDPPFNQYGLEVEAILHRFISLKTGAQDPYAKLVEVGWYLQLGIAHRTRVQKFPSQSDGSIERDDEASLHAFLEAIARYQELGPAKVQQAAEQLTGSDYFRNVGEVQISIANAYNYLAELYQMTEGEDDRGVFSIALLYYKEAATMYQEILQSSRDAIDLNLDVDALDAIEFNLAETWVRIGSILLDARHRGLDGTTQDYEFSDSGDLNHMIMDLQEAEQVFAKALPILQKQVESYKDDPEWVFVQLQLASAMQHHATSLFYLNKLDEAIEDWEDAHVILQSCLLKFEEGSLEQEDAAASLAEILISLSDTYLQKGDYDNSLSAYESAMDLYRVFGFSMPSMQDSILDTEETLAVYESELEEYRESIWLGREIPMHDDVEDEYYEADDLYEAGLHSTLGAIRLSRDEAILAVRHFQTAVDLYEAYLGEEEAIAEREMAERAIADVKINHAMALARLGEYKDSVKVRREAMELYRSSVPEGENPLVEDFVEFNHQKGGNNKQGDSKSTKGGDDEIGVKERLINIDSYRQSVLNMTVGAEKKVQEEL